MTKTVLDKEQRRREGRELIAELRKWEDRPSDKLFNSIMLARLLEAKTYAEIDHIVCLFEKRLHEHTMSKLSENL